MNFQMDNFNVQKSLEDYMYLYRIEHGSMPTKFYLTKAQYNKLKEELKYLLDYGHSKAFNSISEGYSDGYLGRYGSMDLYRVEDNK